jgi:hypothetical protein
MRTKVSFLTVVLVLAGCSIATLPSPDGVVVKALDQRLPSEEEKEEEFLWDVFANKPNELKFESYTTEHWKQNFELFAAILVKKADDQRLDSISLRKVLNLVLKDSEDRIAYLPVGAYQMTLDGAPVWVITVKWENARTGKRFKLMHIRIFVFNQKSLKQVGFCTCA